MILKILFGLIFFGLVFRAAGDSAVWTSEKIKRFTNKYLEKKNWITKESLSDSAWAISFMGSFLIVFFALTVGVIFLWMFLTV